MGKARTNRIFHVFIAFIGYLLSPLSWWNDLFINIPLAYLFSLPFSIISEKLFLYMFVLGYWLSNLLGLLLMHTGISAVIFPEKQKWDWRNSLLTSLIYTIVIVLLVRSGLICLPSLNVFKKSSDLSY